ncbi:MAG: hypothetical protein WCV83_03775 [Candidatus Magasanikbacteria bacterium]|jgi:hypothetical protein
MAWYKKQLTEKLKKNEDKNSKKETSKKSIGHVFDPSKIKGNKHTFKNPVAEMNRNRKKTDIF